MQTQKTIAEDGRDTKSVVRRVDGNVHVIAECLGGIEKTLLEDKQATREHQESHASVNQENDRLSFPKYRRASIYPDQKKELSPGRNMTNMKVQLACLTRRKYSNLLWMSLELSNDSFHIAVKLPTIIFGAKMVSSTVLRNVV